MAAFSNEAQKGWAAKKFPEDRNVNTSHLDNTRVPEELFVISFTNLLCQVHLQYLILK